MEATDVAAETGDIILVNSDPNDVVNMIAFAKATYRKMVQSFFGIGYNVVAIPPPANILYPQFVLSRASGFSINEFKYYYRAFNAQLLKRQFR